MYRMMRRESVKLCLGGENLWMVLKLRLHFLTCLGLYGRRFCRRAPARTSWFPGASLGFAWGRWKGARWGAAARRKRK